MIEVESIDPNFTGGSSVGGRDRIEMPGTAPAPLGPITVTAGQTSTGNDVTLIGTPPRFDAVRGPVMRPLQNRWRALATSLVFAFVAACGGGGGGDNGGGGGGPLNITTTTADDGVDRRDLQRDDRCERRQRREDFQHQRRRVARRTHR